MLSFSDSAQDDTWHRSDPVTIGLLGATAWDYPCVPAGPEALSGVGVISGFRARGVSSAVCDSSPCRGAISRRVGVLTA